MLLDFDYLTVCLALAQVMMCSIQRSCSTERRDVKLCFMHDRVRLHILNLPSILVLVYFLCQMVHRSIMDDHHLEKKKVLCYRTDPHGLSRSEFELLPL